MVHNWVLCLSLLCAAPDQGPVLREAEARALLEESRQCLLKKGKGWDDSAWVNVYEWNVCLEEQLLRKLNAEQKMKIKGYLAELGYYQYDPKKQTFSNAKKKIHPRDVDSILSVIGSVVLPGKRETAVVTQMPRPAVPATAGAMTGKPIPAAPAIVPSVPAPAAPVNAAAKPAAVIPVAPAPRPSVKAGKGLPVPPAVEAAKPREMPPSAPAAVVPSPRPATPAIEGGGLPTTLPEDRVVFGFGSAFLPKGVFLLVKKGNVYGAIRITEFGKRDKAGTAIYETYFQEDGSGSFAPDRAEKRGGRVTMKAEGAAGRRSSRRGSSVLRVGKWSFEYAEPGCVKMYSYLSVPGDQGFEFAPVAIGDLSALNVRDQRIQWYTCDMNGKVEILLKDLLK